MNQITVLIVATTVAFAGLARAAPAKSSPSLWEMFNATDPGPEYWEERRFWPHFYKNLKKLPLNFCFQSTERALFRNSSYHHYLHNDIYIPEERQGMAGSEWRWPGGMIPVRIDPSWSTCIRLTCSYHLQYSIFLCSQEQEQKQILSKGCNTFRITRAFASKPMTQRILNIIGSLKLSQLKRVSAAAHSLGGGICQRVNGSSWNGITIAFPPAQLLTSWYTLLDSGMNIKGLIGMIGSLSITTTFLRVSDCARNASLQTFS